MSRTEPPRRPTRLLRAAAGLGGALLVLGLIEGGLTAYGLGAKAYNQWAIRKWIPVTDKSHLVIFVGDSVVQGAPLGAKQSFPYQLSNHPELHPDVSIAQLGAAGEGMLARHRAVEATLEARSPAKLTVVMMAGRNDCAYLRNAVDETPLEDGGTVTAVRDALRGLRTYRLLSQVLLRFTPAEIPAIPTSAAKRDDPRLDHCAQTVVGGVHAFASTVSAYAGELWIAGYPAPPVARTPGAKIGRIVNHLLKEQASAQARPYIDTRACLQRAQMAGETGLFQRDDVHMTEAGNAVLARCMGDALGIL